ncbi:unnamed protein product [Oppiella nova]|uniref:Uncharacterized protein n=1 Tax=Oppiella nova TaxID=334625 RepID=A0A7R9MIR0_9ACAR|nr:unnamed protein product [Oppiella nova]CAG2177139.1 unnamed protein product [Oppiella nova]
MVYTYVSNWKSLLFQCIIYQLLGIIILIHYNWDMIKPNGCLEVDFTSGNTCNKTLDELLDETYIQQNIKYNLLVAVSIVSVIVVVMSATFCSDLLVFNREHQNDIQN